MGTDGFEFVEYAHPEPEKLGKLFETMGFTLVAKHRSKNVQLWRQGDVNFVVNAEPDSFAQRFAAEHGPCACAMAFRVVDAKYAYERALSLGAEPGETKVGPMELVDPRDQGHRRLAALFRRPLWRQGLDLGCGFRLDRRARPEAGKVRPVLSRSSDPQCAARPHGSLGRLVSEAVQFPRHPLLQYRGQADRPDLARDDQPVRQDPHPDQRVARRQVADRGISARISSGEGIQHVAMGCRDIYESVAKLG